MSGKLCWIYVTLVFWYVSEIMLHGDLPVHVIMCKIIGPKKAINFTFIPFIL